MVTTISIFEAYGFKITAEHVPGTCTECPFWLVNMITLESGECFITGHEIIANGPQDEKRMNDCPIKEEIIYEEDDIYN